MGRAVTTQAYLLRQAGMGKDSPPSQSYTLALILLDLLPWTNNSISLCLSVLICKMQIIIALSSLDYLGN